MAVSTCVAPLRNVRNGKLTLSDPRASLLSHMASGNNMPVAYGRFVERIGVTGRRRGRSVRPKTATTLSRRVGIVRGTIDTKGADYSDVGVDNLHG